MRRLTWWVVLAWVLVMGLLAGLVAGVALGKRLALTQSFLVYTDGNPNAWEVSGLDEAEKKAHFLIYECDAKLAVVTDPSGRLVAQIRKSDGRDIGGAAN